MTSSWLRSEVCAIIPVVVPLQHLPKQKVHAVSCIAVVRKKKKGDAWEFFCVYENPIYFCAIESLLVSFSHRSKAE